MGGVCKSSFDYLFRRKRKHDQSDGSNGEDSKDFKSSERSSKRARLHENRFEDYETVSRSSVTLHRIRMASFSPWNGSPPLYDESDDDSDVEILEDKQIRRDIEILAEFRKSDPDVQVIGYGTRKVTPNRPVSTKEEVFDLEALGRYSKLLERSRGGRSLRSSTLLPSRYFDGSDPSKHVRKVVLYGSLTPATSRARNRGGPFEAEPILRETKERLKGLDSLLLADASPSCSKLTSPLSERNEIIFGRGRYQRKSSRGLITNVGGVDLRRSIDEKLLSPHGFPLSYQPESTENHDEASECVSVSETSSSEASHAPVESQNLDIKRCTSLERLDNLCNGSSLSMLSEKFKQWDLSPSLSSLVKTKEAKAARNELRSKMTKEAQVRRDARIATRKSHEDEIKLRMRLEGLLVEDKELVEEFVDLTKDQLVVVKRAVEGKADDVVSEGFNLRITRRDLRTLLGLEWLNDEIINFFMNLIMERSGKNGLPRVYATNTFFYPKLVERGYNTQLSRWTRKVDIFSFDIMLVPIHLGVHWCLGVVDFRKKAIMYYDSMGGANEEALRSLLEYLESERMDKKKERFDITGWQLDYAPGIPRQMNGSDCGMFTCRFAEYVSRDARISFTQANMPYFRRRTMYEIVTKRLL